MDQNKVALTTKRMIEARTVILRDNPFFGRLSLGLQLACASCGTVCTDGERLIFDPDFAEQLKTEEEMQFLILHEVLHCVLEHCTRVGTRNSELYNIACDIVVNSTIFGMWGINTFQVAGEEPIHLAPDGKEGREYNAEEVYQMLLSDSDSDAGGDGKKMIDRHDVWKAIRNENVVRENWNKRIQKAYGDVQGTVQLPQNIRKIADDLNQRSKVNWKQMLHDFLQYDEYDYSFQPPDKRFSAGDFFLPAYNIDEDKGTVRDIWICMDTSASVNDKELKEAMFEVQDAMRQTGLTGSISFFDGNITDPEPFSNEEEFKAITPSGGGWTNCHLIFNRLEKYFYPDLPRAILIFTDGFVADWPKEEAALGVPVLWIISSGGNARVPWGQVIEL